MSLADIKGGGGGGYFQYRPLGDGMAEVESKGLWCKIWELSPALIVLVGVEPEDEGGEEDEIGEEDVHVPEG